MSSASPPDPLPPDHDIGSILEVSAYVFLFPAIITTALRLGVRIRDKTLGSDDYTMIVATALTIVLSALSILAVKEGKGRHVWYLSPHQQHRISMLSWANQIVLFCSITMIKTSICLLILRIKRSKLLQWILYSTIALLALTNLIPIIALCVECQPTSEFWQRNDPSKCNKPDFRIYSIYLQTAYSVLTDFTCSIIPVIIVWQLNLSKPKKTGICVLMSMGLVCTAFACLRATSLSTDISDTTYAYTYAGTWSTIETNLGIFAANLAPIRALLVKLFPRLLLTRHHTSSFPYARRSRGTIPGTAGGGGTSRFGTGTGPGRDPYGFPDEGDADTETGLGGKGRRGSLGSDRSQIPLKEVVQTREVRVDFEDAGEGRDRGRDVRGW